MQIKVEAGLRHGIKCHGVGVNPMGCEQPALIPLLDGTVRAICDDISKPIVKIFVF